MSKSITLEAPAKINYRLDVIGRRPDGYHELRMIMQRINLCDRISITLGSNPGISVVTDNGDLPQGEGNIAWRAAAAICQQGGYQGGVEIRIEKNIPVAAGLGGGSSDCATVLIGMNSLLELGLSTDELMEIGVRLGADVPFFLFQRTALAEGIGERLTPMGNMPNPWVLLVNPNVPVSTAWVYGNLKLTQRRALDTIPDSFETVTDLCKIVSNDLEPVTISACPIIGEIKASLMANGACCSLMSGSGPTVFALFEQEETARQAADIIGSGNSYFVAVVETI